MNYKTPIRLIPIRGFYLFTPSANFPFFDPSGVSALTQSASAKGKFAEGGMIAFI
jgi:hypothetical protein